MELQVTNVFFLLNYLWFVVVQTPSTFIFVTFYTVIIGRPLLTAMGDDITEKDAGASDKQKCLIFMDPCIVVI